MENINCSIIVAEFNNGRYFNDLYQSILRQTYINWELIIVDDCSTDNTIELIKPYLNDTRVKLIKHEQNKGGGAAFKTATDNSKGKIVALLGADDALVENAIELIVNKHLEHPEASMIYAKLIFCDENLNVIEPQSKFNIPQDGKTLLEYSSSVGWQTFKKKYYLRTEGFDPNFKRAIDQDLVLKMEEVGKIKYYDEPLYLYRRMKNSISQGEASYKSKEYYYFAVYKAYERRKKNGFRNISHLRLTKFRSDHQFIKYKLAIESHSKLAVLYFFKSALLYLPNYFSYSRLRIIFLDFLYYFKNLVSKRKQ